jgi:hypothetical protein
VKTLITLKALRPFRGSRGMLIKIIVLVALILAVFFGPCWAWRIDRKVNLWLRERAHLTAWASDVGLAPAAAESNDDLRARIYRQISPA